MLVSYNWLQKYFEKPLPPAKDIAHALTFGVAEIESVEERNGDTLIDVKVLPDRACYLLSHRGIAKEIATLMNLSLKHDPLATAPTVLAPRSQAISAAVAEPSLSPYYGIALVRGVKVGPSPKWLKDALEGLGQRSINNVVDATNYVMLDLGTPLHAFDARKTSGKILVRKAAAGEKIQLLGGAEKELVGEEALITDAETDAPLALAGVKGGALAELNLETTDIILEAATFDPVRTRKTATRHDVRTDASKRFENSVAPELPSVAMRELVTLITEVAGGVVEGCAEAAEPIAKPFIVGVSGELVRSALGLAVSDADIMRALEKIAPVEQVNHPRETALAVAREQLGKPYKLGASISREAPDVFDCSSLTAWAYLHAGVTIPRVSVDQFVWGEPVEKKDLLPGDLIFFNTKREHVNIWYNTVDFIKGTPVPEGVSHVAMYVGDGVCIHARKTDGKVLEEQLDAVEARVECVGYRRMAHDVPHFVLKAPVERLDLRIPEDLVEEVGRIHGYDHVPSTPLPGGRTQPEVLPVRYWSEVIRGALTQAGFLEIMNYSLRESGEVRLLNALASDKSYLRGNLADGMQESLSRSEYNLPLVGGDEVRTFEMGTAFAHDTESMRVCVAARAKPGKKRDERTAAILTEAKEIILGACGVPELPFAITSETVELDISAMVAQMPAPQKVYPSLPLARTAIAYEPLSTYPFVLRDIALWVPAETGAVAVESVLRDHAGEQLVALSLFDQFQKEGRTSFAFHLVFQSKEKTLSDEEVTGWMNTIVAAAQTHGWEVR
ncbi:MAG: C40 family peptidase [Candidatus Pacebacteria bacterium]|nr:C40 family peptidase [Candidatus Paceibacterota bacterium]